MNTLCNNCMTAFNGEIHIYAPSKEKLSINQLLLMLTADKIRIKRLREACLEALSVFRELGIESDVVEHRIKMALEDSEALKQTESK